jgi:DNA-binding winged helix-turn-helix (wHTH) protein
MDLEPGSNLHFGPFSLDGADGDLWRGSERCKLTAKAEAVLRYLVAHPGRLVRKADLLAAIWPDTYVSDWALTTCIREIRQALGDVAKTPQYIATVYRQGYRFIAPVRQAGLASVCTKTSEAHHSLQIASTVPPVHFVGREAELAQMHQWLREALQGKRQIGVIAGETGIGKTALVNAFVSHVITTEDLWVGQGQCINHYGVGEPYLPVLDALGRLCRGPKGEHFLAILRQHAPSWLAAIPAGLTASERASIPFTASADTQVRMLRELAETIEVLSMECPLLLVFEDVHWSDTSTLDWLAFVAQRRDPAHLY